MRMEELRDGAFIKSTDSVERYLLNVIQSYFESMNLTDVNSREYIVQKAVERIKEEFSIDNAGVLSVNGQIGVVTITLEDLNGEPKIEVKKNAFNVDFGNEAGTACEGNDPRLSDARTPLSHTHELEDITGISGLVSSIESATGTIQDYEHIHSNKNILDRIVYSGDKATIDLFFIDGVETNIKQLEALIEEKLTPLPAAIQAVETEINDKILTKQTEMNKFVQDTSASVTLIKDQNDTLINQSFETIKTELSSMFSAQVDFLDIEYVIEAINKISIPLVEGEFILTDDKLSFKELSTAITSEYNFLQLNFDYELILEKLDGSLLSCRVPYHDILNGETESIITVSVVEGNQIKYQIVNYKTPISNKYSSIKIKYKGYGNQSLKTIL